MLIVSFHSSIIKLGYHPLQNVLAVYRYLLIGLITQTIHIAVSTKGLYFCAYLMAKAELGVDRVECLFVLFEYLQTD